MPGQGPRIHRPDEADEFPIAERCRILETWNRPDDPALSVARARVAPGVTTRLHRLTGICERYLILSGQGRVEVGDLLSLEGELVDVALEGAGARVIRSSTVRTDVGNGACEVLWVKKAEILRPWKNG